MEKKQASKRYTATKKFDIRTLTMVAVLVILWVVFAFLTSDGFKSIDSSFLSTRNLSNLMRSTAVVGIMGSTMVLIIVTNGIDLSAGSMVGFIGCTAAALQVFQDMNTPATVALCLVLSIFIYFVMGMLIAYANIAPFIVTLGGQLMFKGAMLAVTGGTTVAPLKESLAFFGSAYVTKTLSLILGIVACALLLFSELQRRAGKRKHGTLTESVGMMLVRWALFSAGIMVAVLVLNAYRGMPVPVLIMFVLVVLVKLVADRTTFGRSVYAIGGNIDAAKYSGINVRRNLVCLYMLHGLMIGISGLLLTARLNAGSTQSGLNMELDAIAAAVIGGASMSGGVGTPVGAILGALIMESINNGASMMNLDAYWQYIIKGIILVAAVWFDGYTRSRKKS